MDEFYNYQLAGATDKGRRRTRNEDDFSCTRTGEEGRYALAVVADGLGAYRGSDEAAHIAVSQLPVFVSGWQPHLNAAEHFSQEVLKTHNTIYERKFCNAAWRDMCCVMTAVLFDAQKHELHLCHVGDARLYAFSGERLVKITKDHSPVGLEEECGRLTEMEAMRHPARNVVERVAGDKVFDRDEFDENYQQAILPAGRGITYLLATDGLFDMITSAEIISLLSADTPLEGKVAALIDAANAAGGKDNVTVVLVRDCGYGQRDPAEDARIMDLYALYGRDGYRRVPSLDEVPYPQTSEAPETDVHDGSASSGYNSGSKDEYPPEDEGVKEHNAEVLAPEEEEIITSPLDFSLVVDDDNRDDVPTGTVIHQRNRMITCLLTGVTLIILLLLGVIVWTGIDYRQRNDWPQFDYSWHENLYYNALKNR